MRVCIAAFSILFFITNLTLAVSPKPGLFDQRGYCPKTAASLPSIESGIDEPEPLVLPVAGERTAIVLLVHFTDNRANTVSHSPASFQKLLFDSTGAVATGSMHEYYDEVSYGRLFLTGHVSVWLEAPRTNAYYADDQFGQGRWPANRTKLAYDVVVAADPYIDFSRYDGDGDGEVDALFIIHAGPGGEETGNTGDLWSHKGTIPATAGGAGRGYLTDDGVKAAAYTMQPEEDEDGHLIGIGVFCHEYGHILGLPDLYDRDNSSMGIGYWGLMGSGSWGGDGQSPETPVHLCAWSKEQLGWVDPIVVDRNTTLSDINTIELSPEVFRLWTGGSDFREYFLISNRQRVGFDSNLPNSGLLIWHIDTSVGSQNDNEEHKLVDLEAADGNDDMDGGGNRGDAGDPYPGSTNKRIFDLFSHPDSKSNLGPPSQVAVRHISDSGMAMSAEVQVIEETPMYDLRDVTVSDARGNNDGKADPGEHVDIIVSLGNYGEDSPGVRGTLSTTDPAVDIVNDRVWFPAIPFFKIVDNEDDPFSISVSPSTDVHYGYFTLALTTDGGGGPDTLSFRIVIGHPHVLVIDDDEDDSGSQWTFDVEEYYRSALDSIDEVHDYWNRLEAGTPGSDLLQTYTTTIWFTGNADPPLTSLDIDHLAAFLDAGGNLFLSGQNIASELDHSPFLTGYLHAGLEADTSGEGFLMGVPGDPISGGVPGLLILSGADAANNQPSPDAVIPLDGAAPVFRYATSGRTAALKYEGEYRLVYFAFGFEALSSLGPDSRGLREQVMNNILRWLQGEATGIEVDDRQISPPDDMSLSQNYPNPFNLNTAISFQLSAVSDQTAHHSLPATLKVYNLLGQEIRTLVDTSLEPGYHTVSWDGRDRSGHEVASGVYFYRLKTGHFSRTKRMLLLK